MSKKKFLDLKTPIVWTALIQFCLGLICILALEWLFIQTYDVQRLKVYWRFVILCPLALLSFSSLFRLPHWIPVALVSIVILIDLSYFKVFDVLVSISSIAYAHQLLDVVDSAASTLSASAMIVLLIFFIWCLLSFLLARQQQKREWAFFTQASFAFLLISGVATTLLIQDTARWLETERSWKVIDQKDDIRRGGILYAHLRDIIRYIREEQFTDVTADEYKMLLAQQERLDRERRRTTVEIEKPTPHPHIVFIQLEAFQSFLIDLHIDGVPVTPFLNMLKTRTLYFSEIYDLTGPALTADCGFMVMNSHYPLDNGAVVFRRPQNDWLAFPQVLNKNGYTSTRSIHAYRKGVWNRSMTHPRWGIDQMAFRSALPQKPRIGWGLSDKALFQFLKTNTEYQYKNGTFDWVITLTSHHPYHYVKKPYPDLNIELKNKMLSAYLQSARFVDEALRDYVAYLEEQPDTIYVIYGDHDARMKYGSKTAKRFANYTGLSLETSTAIGRRDIRVDKIPVLIGGDIPVLAQQITNVGSQIDIAPTMLSLLGIETPKHFLGRSLLASQRIDSFATARLWPDGSAVNQQYIFRKHPEKCYLRADGQETSLDDCNDLKTHAEALRQLSDKKILSNHMELTAGVHQ